MRFNLPPPLPPTGPSDARPVPEIISCGTDLALNKSTLGTVNKVKGEMRGFVSSHFDFHGASHNKSKVGVRSSPVFHPPLRLTLLQVYLTYAGEERYMRFMQSDGTAFHTHFFQHGSAVLGTQFWNAASKGALPRCSMWAVALLTARFQNCLAAAFPMWLGVLEDPLS